MADPTKSPTVSVVENRPFIEVFVNNQRLCGLLDSGANTTVMPMRRFESIPGLKLHPTNTTLTAANDGALEVCGAAHITYKYGKRACTVTTIIVSTLSHDVILGCDFWKAMGLTIAVDTVSENSGDGPETVPTV